MKATLSDIAKRTGLSVASVSRALHRADSRNVSEETRNMVHAVARDLGYRPNLMSRSLVTGRTQTISYWSYHAFSSYYSLVARTICQQAAARKYSVHIHNTLDWEEEVQGESSGTSMALSFDGIIACDVSPHRSQYPESAKAYNVPLVMMGIKHSDDCDHVSIDLEYGAELAVRHLLELGCRDVAYIGHPQPLVSGEPRALVLDKLFGEAGLQPRWIDIVHHTREEARERIQVYVQEKGVPEAIFCVNDEVAVGCYRGLADIGIEVPRDVLLVGFDGLPEAEFQRCPITTVAISIPKMCELAWELLEKRINAPAASDFEHIVLKPELIIRESTIGRKAP
jgi:LacI family transcriptional regulator